MIKVGDILLLTYNSDKMTDICMVTYEPNQFHLDCNYRLKCLVCGDTIGCLNEEDLQNIKNVLQCDNVKVIKNKEFIGYINNCYKPKYKIKRHNSILEEEGL